MAVSNRPSRGRARTVVAAFAAGLLWLGCSQDANEPTGPDAVEVTQQGLRPAINVQERYTEGLLAIPGVVGTAVGLAQDGRPVIKVFAAEAGLSGVPSDLENFPVEVEVTGMFVALSATTDPTQRQTRPVPIGVSTGHPDITAGTIGARVTDGSGNVYALSNNHIYADQNDANIGDSALQPGDFDGGSDPADKIGELFDFEPLDFSGGNNVMDAAIALSSVADLGNSTPSDNGYGIPSAVTAAAFVGQPVKKYGRTTLLTQGDVVEVNATVDVCYETRGPFRCVKLGRFVGQISISPGSFSDGGDSGSLIVTDDANNNPVGLLFAGSTTRTIASPIDPILSRFGVTIDDDTDPPPPPPPGTTDVAVTDVSAPASATIGDVVAVDVTVENIGSEDVAADIDVTLTDDTDGNTIGTQTISGGLTAGASTTLNFSWATEGASIGSHTLTAEHYYPDDDATNNSATATVNIEEPAPPAAGMHIGDLDGLTTNEGRTWSVILPVAVHDADHNPVNLATITGVWTDAFIAVDECTTDPDGDCLLLNTLIPKREGSVMFEVSDVTHGTLVYSPADNHDADGDSDGTTIVVNKP